MSQDHPPPYPTLSEEQVQRIAIEDTQTPKEVLRLLGLHEAIKPLAAIVRQNQEYSSIVEQVLELAMIIGYHAGERTRARAEVIQALEGKLADQSRIIHPRATRQPIKPW